MTALPRRWPKPAERLSKLTITLQLSIWILGCRVSQTNEFEVNWLEQPVVVLMLRLAKLALVRAWAAVYLNFT